MHARVLIVICIIMATATDGSHGHLFHRWLTRGQLPAPCQHADAAASSRAEALPASALDTAWFEVADDKRNSVMYFAEMKQELFLFGDAPAVPAKLTTPGTTTDITVPATSFRALATSASAPATSTSAPAKSTSAPATSTRVPATSTSAAATSTSAAATSTSAKTTSTRVPAMSTSAPPTSISAPATSTRVPATSTSAPATSTSVPTMDTSEPITSYNALLPSSTIPPGYTYSLATGSYYKFHNSGVTWDEANTTCASEGAHLLVLNDAVEADIVARIVSDAAGYLDTWTGLRDNRPGGVMEWRTVHGEPLSDVYNEWSIYQPYNDAGWTCAYFYAGNKLLYDVPCDWSWYFTCEISQ